MNPLQQRRVAPDFAGSWGLVNTLGSCGALQGNLEARNELNCYGQTIDIGAEGPLQPFR